jgi:GAF domain-containing protein
VDGSERAVVVASMSALPSVLLSTEAPDRLLHEVATLAARIVDPPAACGITVRREGSPVTVASSDPRADVVDEEQYAGGAGPCLETLRTGVRVEVVDLDTDDRWPRFRAHALGHGVRSTLSLPLTVDGETLGAMNVYRFAQERFSADEVHRAELFAAQAAATLALQQRQARSSAVARQLEEALTSRTVIDQALGVLMAQQRCTAEEAFALLRAHSQNTNRRLRDVAADLITRVTGSPPAAAPPFEPPG